MLRTKIAMLFFGLFVTITAGAGDNARETERVFYDGLDELGRLTGGLTHLPRPDLSVLPVAGAAWTTIVDNGPSSNRIDMVFVGDGYLASELGIYATHVTNGLDDIMPQVPFANYASYFNFHRVDVISNESGVDHDPVQGILRDTALDMGFWCQNIERLLCVSVAKAYQFANNAPDVDQVLAVANSTKYGGAGYASSNLATFTGGNGASTEIAIHEIGHSLGDLADEYDYNDGATYNGPEPLDRNVSILIAAAMGASGTKWSHWLGHSGVGFGGLVDTYEGAAYYEFGIYRPTFDSKMRNLDQPFNLPSIEGIILEIYKQVVPIDDATPTGMPLTGTETVFIVPLDPVSHALDVQWYLDGVVVAGATGNTIDLASMGLALGSYELSVTAVDNTDFVRDEIARDLLMSQTLTWEVIVIQTTGSCCLPDMSCLQLQIGECRAMGGTFLGVGRDCVECPGCPISNTRGSCYGSIQEAINAAQDFDEIIVGPGVYPESINFLDRRILLRSEAGPQTTTISGQGGSVVTINSSVHEQDTELRGFTITGGNASEGGGLHFGTGTPTVRDCIINNNVAQTWGGGMYNNSASPTLIGCVFSNNTCVDKGGGVANSGAFGNTIVTNCVFKNNTSQSGNGGAIYTDPANTGTATVSGSSFCGNTPEDIVGGLNGSIDNGGNYCCGDMDHDGVTGTVDLLQLLADWGRCPPVPEPCPADFDDDDIVGITDLLTLLAAWGGPCPLFR